jgi:hypothetical protein
MLCCCEALFIVPHALHAGADAVTVYDSRYRQSGVIYVLWSVASNVSGVEWGGGVLKHQLGGLRDV